MVLLLFPLVALSPFGKEPIMTGKKTMTKAVQVVEAAYTPTQIALVKRTVAKGATDDELKMFFHVAKKTCLDPFLKEIWFYKDKKGNSLIFTGRDGFLSIAVRSGLYSAVKSGAVRENDIFEMDMANNSVKHIITKPAERGKIIGAWATSYKKDAEPISIYVDMATFNKGYSAWASHPEDMIIKVAEAKVLKKHYGITGIVSEEEKASIGESKPELLPVVENETINNLKTEVKDKGKEPVCQQ